MRVVPIHPGVIDPRTMRPLPAGGVNVAESIYWRRREAHGEVAIDPPDSPDPDPTPKKKRAAP